MKWTVEGEVPSLKNTVRHGRYGQIYHKNDVVAHYKSEFDFQTPKVFKLGLMADVLVRVRLVRSNKRKDPLNLIDTIADCIEYAGVIKNDRQIVKWEIDATTCNKKEPRVEIELEEL